MSMSDPIADALTRIRNALRSKHSLVVLPKSRTVTEIVRILKEEGYIEDFITKKAAKRDEIHIALKYDAQGEPVISCLDRVSLPGRRVYCGKDEIPAVLGNLGLSVLSTSRGLMTSRTAQKLGLGGEILCKIY
ncbi:MAG: 30S ribosomal protein S8 [Acidobacteria bacterium]|nr:30S ribosomal protein S8 [Acidobacteriota bacterium]